MLCYSDQAEQKRHNKIGSCFNIALVLAVIGLFGNLEAQSKTNVYKKFQSDGQVEYSDQQTPESSQVVLPQIQTNPSVPSPIKEADNTQNVNSAGEGVSKQQEQFTISITSPIDQQAFISAVTDLPVTVIVKPKFDPSYKIICLLDNQEYGAPQTTDSFTLKNILRGTHQLQVVLKDAQDQALATSAPIIFHQQRQVIKK